MRKTFKHFVTVMMGILLGVWLAQGSPRGEMLGEKAPDFLLNDLQGRPFQLSRHLDKPVMLIHMQVYCHACREETPVLNQVRRERSQVHIVAVFTGNDQAEVAAFKEAFQVEFLILPDPDKEVFKKYGLSSVPFVDVIDQTGIIRYRGVPESLSEIEGILDGVMKE